MNRPIKREWLEPFRQQPELEAQAYEMGFEPRLPRRTALNRLGRLREAGLVERQGEARSTIYRLTEAGRSRLEGDRSRPPMATQSQGASLLSPEVEAVRARLRRPVTERPPVGYQRSFLESYQPNQTFYLPESARRKLFESGSQTGMADEPAGTYARHICQRLLIDLSWNSSRLEGNTYSLLETEQLFQAGRSGDANLSNEAVMILNHKAAIEFLLESSSEAGFNRRTILNLHALLTADLLRDPAAEGALRTDPVGIGKSSYLPPAIPALIETLFDQILAKAGEIRDPYEQAFFVMVHLPYLQPFIDGNKRVSRLAANLPLFQRNLAPLSFVDVSETDYTDGMLAIYELNDLDILREVFIQAYERSAQRYTVIRGAVGDPDGINYMRLNSDTIDPKGHATDIFTDWACGYVREQATAAKPFFLYLAYNAPHFPIEPPADFLEKVKIRLPALDQKRAMNVAFVEHLDDRIGKVLEALKDAGLEKNTIVVFTSDNGGSLHHAQNNDPWRGGKQDHYEGGLRVPFMVRWPGHIRPGTRSDYQGLNFDIFPTFLEIAGVRISPELDAVSLVPILNCGTITKPRDLYFVRREGGLGYGGKSYEAIIRDGWKHMQNDPYSPLELYHLSDDPMERQDRAKDEPSKAAELALLLRAHIRIGGAAPWRKESRERSVSDQTTNE